MNDVCSNLPAQVCVGPLKWTIDAPFYGGKHTGPSLLDCFTKKGPFSDAYFIDLAWSLMSPNPSSWLHVVSTPL